LWFFSLSYEGVTLTTFSATGPTGWSLESRPSARIKRGYNFSSVTIGAVIVNCTLLACPGSKSLVRGQLICEEPSSKSVFWQDPNPLPGAMLPTPVNALGIEIMRFAPVLIYPALLSPMFAILAITVIVFPEVPERVPVIVDGVGVV
jgi:hypothetical protein